MEVNWTAVSAVAALAASLVALGIAVVPAQIRKYRLKKVYKPVALACFKDIERALALGEVGDDDGFMEKFSSLVLSDVVEKKTYASLSMRKKFMLLDRVAKECISLGGVGAALILVHSNISRLERLFAIRDENSFVESSWKEHVKDVVNELVSSIIAARKQLNK